GAAFVWPIFQDYQYLDLTPIPIDIKLEGLPSRQKIRVNMPATVTIGISTKAGVMQNAAERMLGLDLNQIRLIGQEIISGQMRVVVASMDIETLNSDRDLLIEKIVAGVEVELTKVGLRLININIQNITWDSN
ncbi:flotillin family protein, partial [Akkermansiaceae bacterium]|nr:flotillin family protein [Akkermansiaceae bacterium]